MKYFIKAAVMSIIVAFLFIAILYTAVYVVVGDQIIEAISLINFIATDNTREAMQTTEIKFKDNHYIEEYPEFGECIGSISIESIGVDLPLYYGNTLEILKNGVGIAPAGWFPGEGGSIICMGHNFGSFLARLPEVENGDIISISTTYGEYNYEVYDERIIDETDFDALPVQENEEILMIYTCWPINNIGHAYERYVVDAKLK